MYSDAGSGIAGLPNAHQSWVTVTPKMSDWMGQLAPSGSAMEAKPFSTYAIAAAHDAGMNTMAGIKVVTTGVAFALIAVALLAVFPIPSLAALLTNRAPEIMMDLSMTQKETTTSMLQLGVRYVPL